jgi:hypothetical protein
MFRLVCGFPVCTGLLCLSLTAFGQSQQGPARDVTADMAAAAQATTSTQVFQEELRAKGYPQIPHPRASILRKLSLVSAEDCVSQFNVTDLVLTYTFSGGASFVCGTSQIASYSFGIPGNPWVLRLIEEAQKNPNVLGKILQELELEASGFQAAYDNFDFKSTDPGERRKAVEFFWDKTMKIAALQYVLINLGKYENLEQMQRWMRRQSRERCKEWDLWLIWQLTQTPLRKNIEHAARIEEIAGKYGLKKREWVAESRWNEPWLIDDPMLKMQNVNTEGLKTIKVLRIQRGYEVTTEDHAELMRLFCDE